MSVSVLNKYKLPSQITFQIKLTYWMIPFMPIIFFPRVAIIKQNSGFNPISYILESLPSVYV